MLVCLLLVLLAQGYMLGTYNSAMVHEIADSKIDMLLRTQAVQAAIPLWDYEISQIQSQIATLKQEPLVAGARVVDIDPESVRLTFDRQDEMMFPVAPPPVEGKPLRGRVELDYSPREVLVKGARRQLQEWKAADFHLQTQPVNVDGCVQSFTKNVAIATPGAAWQVEIGEREVSVKVNISTEQSTRELRDVPVLIAAPASRKGAWQTLPSTVQVRLTGRAEVVEAIAPEDLTVLVDARRASADKLTVLPVQVYLPPGVILDAVTNEPAAVVLMRGEE